MLELHGKKVEGVENTLELEINRWRDGKIP